MSLIDSSYFVGELNIPNTNVVAISSQLDWFIQKYEPEFLKKVLGSTLASQFIAGIAMPVPEQKWLDLKNGKTYTVNNANVIWQGLVTVTPKASPIANYVYYWYMRSLHTKTASVGEVKGKTENADWVSPGFKMVKAWDDMQAWLCDLLDFLTTEKEVYQFTNTKYGVLCTLGSLNEFNI